MQSVRGTIRYYAEDIPDDPIIYHLVFISETLTHHIPNSNICQLKTSLADMVLVFPGSEIKNEPEDKKYRPLTEIEEVELFKREE